MVEARIEDDEFIKATRTIRLTICALAIAIIMGVFVFLPIWNMNDLRLQFTVDEWAMVIVGTVCSQILILSMYREIKYGGYK